MRHFKLLGGVGAAILTISTSVALAGPLERNATSKANGDMQGQTIRRQSNRAFSYAPQTGASASINANADGANARINAGLDAGSPQPVAENARAQSQTIDSARSFSYQPSQPGSSFRVNRNVPRTPGFFRADRKALGEY